MAYDPRTGTVTFPGFDSTASLLANRTPAMPTAPTPATPESTYDKLLRVMGGGKLSDTLTGGDKLLALSALLGSVARGSRTTPQEVMATIRKEQAGRLEAQVMSEGMKARQQTRQAFLNSLPQNERNMVALLDDKQLAEYMLAKQKGREQTDTEKKLIAAGIDPASPEGQRILKNVAAAQGILNVSGPAGSVFKEAYQVVSGAPAPAGVTFTPIGAPSNAGGPTRPASGGFRKR